MYDVGFGVPQDAAEAIRWYHLAAEQGHAGAQGGLGDMYANGEGVPQDAADAFGGTTWWPSRASLLASTTSRACTPTVRASHRTQA